MRAIKNGACLCRYSFTLWVPFLGSAKLIRRKNQGMASICLNWLEVLLSHILDYATLGNRAWNQIEAAIFCATLLCYFLPDFLSFSLFLPWSREIEIRKDTSHPSPELPEEKLNCWVCSGHAPDCVSRGEIACSPDRASFITLISEGFPFASHFFPHLCWARKCSRCNQSFSTLYMSCLRNV